MPEEQLLCGEMFTSTMEQIEDAKRQGKISVIVGLNSYCDFIRVGWSDPPPLIDRLLEKLGNLGYATYAKLTKDTALKIEWACEIS